MRDCRHGGGQGQHAARRRRGQGGVTAAHTCTAVVWPNREPVDVAWFTHSRALPSSASTCAEERRRGQGVRGEWVARETASLACLGHNHVVKPLEALQWTQARASVSCSRQAWRGEGRRAGRASVKRNTATSGSSVADAQTRWPRLRRALLPNCTARVKKLAARVTLACRGRQAASDEQHKAPARAAGASKATRMRQAYVMPAAYCCYRRKVRSERD